MCKQQAAQENMQLRVIFLKHDVSAWFTDSLFNRYALHSMPTCCQASGCPCVAMIHA